ncbi:MAG: prefoldin subunit beta [Thermofilaceae archaeon]
MAGVSEALRAEVKRYQDLVERLRLIAINRQQLQAQLTEVDEALKELSTVDDSHPVYKIVGTIIVLKSKSSVVNELNNLKETIEIRIKTLEKQEDLLKKQLEELEKKLARKLGGEAQAGAG